MYPYERLVLLGFAVLRAELTLWVPVIVCALFGLALWRIGTTRAVIVVVLLALGSLLAAGTALTSADVIEHHLKLPLLGYTYNPFVMAIGEWEGWMGPTSEAGYPAWQRAKCRMVPVATPWWGDPGSGSFCR